MSSNSPDSDSDLHQQFRTLTALLTSVTVNHQGYPFLDKASLGKLKGRIYNGPLDNQTDWTRETLLNSLAALLVRDAEVIALIPRHAPVDSEKHTFHGIAAISNPDSEDRYCIAKELKHPVLLVKDGESYWEELSQDPWARIIHRRSEPLANHIKTLSDYLLSYRDSEDDQRGDLFRIATCYLISSSWKKMRRRARQWSSLGYLHILLDLGESKLSYAYNHYHSRGNVPQHWKPDFALAHHFMSFTAQIDASMNDYPRAMSVPTGPSGVSNLRKAFQNIIDGETTHSTAYTPDTFIEFHRFLISVIFSYKRSLQRLFTLNQQNKTKEERINVANAVWNYAIILWRTAYSQTLRYHFAVLQYAKLLSLPTFDLKGLYHVVLDAELADKKTESATGTANIEAESEDEADEVDIQLLNVGVETDDLAIAFLRWLRLHVSHFVALHVISPFCARIPKSNVHHVLDISLLAVQPLPRSVDSWESLLYIMLQN